MWPELKLWQQGHTHTHTQAAADSVTQIQTERRTLAHREKNLAHSMG